MYIINNRPNNKKKLYITIFTILIISALLIFIVWYLKKSSNSGTNTRNTTPYSNITRFFLSFQEDAYTYINDINNINKINQTKTKKHPNGLYKEIVYDDGSFLKISEQGKIQQAYCRLISRLNYRDWPYQLYCYDENQSLITLIECNDDTVGYTIKDYIPNAPTRYTYFNYLPSNDKEPSKVTILSHDDQKPYRKVIMKDDKDNKRNFIYNSDEVIYSQYQQEDGIKKLINSYTDTEKYKDVKSGKLEQSGKLEPGNYFLLHTKHEETLEDVLRYDEYLRLKEIKIIKKEDISDSQVPKELQYDKTKESDNSYSHIFKDGTIEYYNPKGELTSIKYPSKLTNNNIIFSYDSDSTKKRWSYKLENSELQPKVISDILEQ